MQQPTEATARQIEPKKGVKKGTPEGDRLIRVRAMKPCTYGTTPAYEKRYEVGEELTIPAWRYTSYHHPEEIKNAKGEVVMVMRGTFEMADRERPVDDNVGKPSESMQGLLNENEELRKRLAILESNIQPGVPKGKKQEI